MSFCVAGEIELVIGPIRGGTFDSEEVDTDDSNMKWEYAQLGCDLDPCRRLGIYAFVLQGSPGDVNCGGGSEPSFADWRDPWALEATWSNMRTKQHTVSSAGTNGRGVEMIPIRYKAEGSAVVPSHYLVAPYLLQNQTLLHPDCFLFHPLLIKSHGKSSWAKSYGDVFGYTWLSGQPVRNPLG